MRHRHALASRALALRLFAAAVPVLGVAALPLALTACDSNNGYRAADVDIYATEFDAALQSAPADGKFRIVEFDVPAITDGVLRAGMVMAYFYDDVSRTWTAMPYTYGIDNSTLQATDFTVTLGFAFKRRTFQVFYESSIAAADVPAERRANRRIKLVVVGPDLAASKQGLDWTNYAAVAAALNLR